MDEDNHLWCGTFAASWTSSPSGMFGLASVDTSSLTGAAGVFCHVEARWAFIFLSMSFCMGTGMRGKRVPYHSSLPVHCFTISPNVMMWPPPAFTSISWRQSRQPGFNNETCVIVTRHHSETHNGFCSSQTVIAHLKEYEKTASCGDLQVVLWVKTRTV